MLFELRNVWIKENKCSLNYGMYGLKNINVQTCQYQYGDKTEQGRERISKPRTKNHTESSQYQHRQG